MFLLVQFYLLTCFMLVRVSLDTNHLSKILEQKDNLFHTLNENVHNIMNRMFRALKLQSDFMNSTKTRLLLTMHSDLNNIAVKYFNIYKDIKNVSKYEYQTNSDKLQFMDILDQIFKERVNENKMINFTEDILKNSTNESNSIESLGFLEDFLRKINTLTVDNFTIILTNETLSENAEILDLRKIKKTNLKLWSPPTHVEREELFNNLTNRRIYKGKRTRVKKYPFMVSVYLMKEFMCAGSIISKELVITAASCLQIVYNNKRLRENPSSIIIRVGSDYTMRFGETVSIKELHFHPQYEPFSLKNNLAILKMAKQLRFLKKKRKIRRIQYDKSATKLQDVDKVTVLGWGATDNVLGVKTCHPLAVADSAVYDFDQCQEIYSKTYVSDTNFCLGFESKGGGACNKDIGGPGIVNGVLIGVISFGPPVCGAPNMPTVLVKLGFYSSWIEYVMKQKPSIAKLREKAASTILKSEEFSTTSMIETKQFYPINTNYARTGTKRDYPEEIVILNQILNDVILSNKSIVDDILYGALEDDFSDIFKPSTKLKLHHHPLVNKSMFLLPEVHDFGKEHRPNVTDELTTSSASLTTTHPGLNIHYMDDYGERIRYMEAAYHLMTVATPPPTRSPTTTEEPPHITDRIGRTRNITLLDLYDIKKEYSEVASSEDSEQISDNYNTQSKENESEGLSIDVEHMRRSEDIFTNPTSKRNIKTEKHKDVSHISINKRKTEAESKIQMVLKKPYTLRGIRKVTKLNIKNNLDRNDKENYISKTSKRKNKMRYRFQ